MKICPTCNKEFDPDKAPDNIPFCSERCRLIDLGAWLTEKHRISEDDLNQHDADTDQLSDDTKH